MEEDNSPISKIFTTLVSFGHGELYRAASIPSYHTRMPTIQGLQHVSGFFGSKRQLLHIPRICTTATHKSRSAAGKHALDDSGRINHIHDAMHNIQKSVIRLTLAERLNNRMIELKNHLLLDRDLSGQLRLWNTHSPSATIAPIKGDLHIFEAKIFTP